MKKLPSHIERLDEVLNLLYNDRGNSNLVSIEKELKIKGSKFEFAADELIRILNKLIKEGYVDFDDVNEGHISPFTNETVYIRRYWITFDGKLLKETGGYQQKQKDIILEHDRLKIENKRNKLINILLVIGAITAGVGTIALVAWEIYKYYHLGYR